MRTPPMYNVPVGLGAKRVRTIMGAESSPGWIDAAARRLRLTPVPTLWCRSFVLDSAPRAISSAGEALSIYFSRPSTIRPVRSETQHPRLHTLCHFVPRLSHDIRTSTVGPLLDTLRSSSSCAEARAAGMMQHRRLVGPNAEPGHPPNL